MFAWLVEMLQNYGLSLAANGLLEDNESYQKESDLKLQTGDETLTSDSDIKPDHPDQSDRGETTKEAEAESPEDIASQVITCMCSVFLQIPVFSRGQGGQPPPLFKYTM